MDKSYEIVIIGGGPSGISAGIYVLRTGVKVLVIDANNSTLEEAKRIDNYYGVEGLSGKELKQKGVDQFRNLGGNIAFDQVLKVVKNYENNSFIVKTKANEISM